jgi:hypothetical protein
MKHRCTSGQIIIHMEKPKRLRCIRLHLRMLEEGTMKGEGI